MVPFLSHRNRELAIDHSPLLDTAVAESHLTADAASGASTISLKAVNGFALSQVLLIGELGDENAEIILVHAATAISGTTVTLASTLVRSHGTGTKVRAILYNQFALSHAATTGGSKTVLTVANGEPPSSLGTGLVAIDPTSKVQKYRDLEQTSGYYFARYYHSVDTVYGDYTDPVPFAGFTKSQVGYVIEASLKRVGIRLSEKVTKDDCYGIITEGLSLIKGKQVRWPDFYRDDHIIGQTSRGTNTVTLPSDIYDDSTNKSIVGVRIGESQNLQYVSPDELEEMKKTALQTAVRSQAAATDTSLAVDNSFDFPDSGAVSVYVANTKYSVEYGAVTRDDADGATAAFTSIPASGEGAITTTIPVDSPVWQNEEEGEPLVYTVRNGLLEFWPLVNSQWQNKNIFMDYETVASTVDSDGDTIDLKRYDMVLDYLTWKVKMLHRNDGNLNMTDGYYISFKERLNDAIRTSVQGRRFRLIPRVNRMHWQGSRRGTRYGDPTT